MLLDLCVVIMQVDVFAAIMSVTTFIEIIQVGVSVAIMELVFSAVHYDYFYYSYAGGCFCCSYVCDSFK